jgi:hypothetical protein
MHERVCVRDYFSRLTASLNQWARSPNRPSRHIGNGRNDAPNFHGRLFMSFCHAGDPFLVSGNGRRRFSSSGCSAEDRVVSCQKARVRALVEFSGLRQIARQIEGKLRNLGFSAREKTVSRQISDDTLHVATGFFEGDPRHE